MNSYFEETILQIFELHSSNFYYPVSTQKEAREIIKILIEKGINQEKIGFHFEENVENLEKWRKSLSSKRVGEKILTRINLIFDQFLDSIELKKPCYYKNFFEKETKGENINRNRYQDLFPEEIEEEKGKISRKRGRKKESKQNCKKLKQNILNDQRSENNYNSKDKTVTNNFVYFNNKINKKENKKKSDNIKKSINNNNNKKDKVPNNNNDKDIYIMNNLNEKKNSINNENKNSILDINQNNNDNETNSNVYSHIQTTSCHNHDNEIKKETEKNEEEKKDKEENGKETKVIEMSEELEIKSKKVVDKIINEALNVISRKSPLQIHPTSICFSSPLSPSLSFKNHLSPSSPSDSFYSCDDDKFESFQSFPSLHSFSIEEKLPTISNTISSSSSFPTSTAYSYPPDSPPNHNKNYPTMTSENNKTQFNNHFMTRSTDFAPNTLFIFGQPLPSGIHRFKIGVCSDLEQEINLAGNYNLDLFLVSSVSLENPHLLEKELETKLEKIKYEGEVGWYEGDIDFVINEINQLTKEIC